jgi:glycosyltransferase involved in cell wall biosynthesis
MLKIAYALADRVVAVSETQGLWLAGGLVRREKLSVIPVALNTSYLEEVPFVRAHEAPVRLGAYGRYAPQKGFDILIEAMRHVSPRVASLSIRGLGPDEAALRAVAYTLPHVTGGAQLTDLPAFFAGIDAVVIPSRWEAFGLVALEARAAARPILVTRTDGLIDQVGPSHGQVCDLLDPKELAIAIYKLCDSDLAAMSRSARQSALGTFDATVLNWKTLLRSIKSDSGVMRDNQQMARAA